MPPIFHILGTNSVNSCSSTGVFELPNMCQRDDPNIAYCTEVEVETEKKSMISPIKNHPASLYDILEKVESIVDFISVDEDGIKEIERSTKNQSKSTEWYAHRSVRITASKCKRALVKDTTSPTKALKDILKYNKNYQSKCMIDGSESEKEIIKRYSNMTGNTVEQCGFFVSKEHPFMGASPDGLVGNNGLIEIKKVVKHLKVACSGLIF